jgi:hypothetical protein
VHRAAPAVWRGLMHARLAARAVAAEAIAFASRMGNNAFFGAWCVWHRLLRRACA